MKTLRILLLLCLITTSPLLAQFAEHTYHYNVDNFPTPYGGNIEMKRHLHDHLIYPAADLKSKKEGTVTISLLVLKDGSAQDIKVLKSVDAAMDKEAVRLVKMIEWYPAHQGTEAVNVNHSVEVDFSVSKYKKFVKQRGFDTILFKEFRADTSFSVYETADQAPLFNVPDKTFTEFVYTTLQYPDAASRQNIEGDVKLSFIIEPDGRTSNVRIKGEGVAGGCNDEAIRLIGLTQWKPAVKNKQYIRYRMYFNMKFSLQNIFKDNSNGSQRTWGQ